ncbi:DoxX family protein [Rhodococcus sp. NBC_00297]|uniref:DoxX family protein n=1 Tax=Rhodococcus sp. NBC_00297 TaxID=2976005 RepID=UPI002E2C1895|nr:DoxX family membrane protein [Rhodococcus sp. NBC_00297]
MIVRRIARPMLASIFIAGGVDALRNPAGRAQAAKPLIEKSQDALPDEVTQNVPSDPETLVKINAAVQIGGGFLLATGRAPRLASTVLAGSLVPTTLAGHSFWNETDPQAKALQRTQFIKNVSLLGGLLIAAVDTEGKPSVAWRGRKAAKSAKVAVAGALPMVSSSDSSETLAHAGERAKELAVVAAERAQPLVEIASQRGAELADVAQDRGGKLAELAKERSAKWADLAAARASEFADVAQDRGSKYAEIAASRGAELAEKAKADGSDLAEKYGKKARKQAKKSGKDARKQFDAARKEYKKQYKSTSKDAQKQLQASLEDAEKRAKEARARVEGTVHQYL